MPARGLQRRSSLGGSFDRDPALCPGPCRVSGSSVSCWRPFSFPSSTARRHCAHHTVSVAWHSQSLQSHSRFAGATALFCNCTISGKVDLHAAWRAGASCLQPLICDELPRTWCHFSQKTRRLGFLSCLTNTRTCVDYSVHLHPFESFKPLACAAAMRHAYAGLLPLWASVLLRL